MEIASYISSVKGVYDIAKGINSLKTDVEKNESISKILGRLLEVQSDALTVQEKYLHLLREKDELAKKLRDLEKWSDIEKQYELKETATGVFVYESKNQSPKHWLCTNCYKDRKASIIQLTGVRYHCPNCKTIFHLDPSANREHGSPRGLGGHNSWMAR